MSLFSFTKDSGESVFSSKDKPEVIGKAMLMNLKNHNPGIENIDVTYDNGTAHISGDAADNAAKEKIVLMVGNFRGVASVDATGITVPPEAPEEKVELYEIKSGDTLSKIAKAYYGKAGDYPRIFDANREVIKDPDKIFVGQMICIPLD